MTRRSALLVSLTAMLAACGVSAQDDDRAIPDDKVPYELLAPPTTTTTAPPASTTTTLPWRTNVWFVIDARVVPTPHQFARQPDVSTLLSILLEGPRDPDAPSLRSALAPDASALAGDPVGGVIDIDLDGTFTSLPAAEQVYALTQLVFTVTEVPGIGRVTFRIDDTDLDVPLPDGQLVQRSVSRDDFAALVYPRQPTG